MRLILKLIKRGTLSLLIFIVSYIALAYIFSNISVNKNRITGNDVDIYILTNGVHTDIVVPAKSAWIDWTQEIKYDHTKSADSNSNYLAIGWGDKGFYLETPTWAELKVNTAMKAAFGLSTSAMHTTYYSTMNIGNDCKKMSLSATQYQNLIEYIKKSFTQSESHCIPVNTNIRYGKTDAFYEAQGSYSLFKTCNTWANSALKSADQKAALWTPFDWGIFEHYR